MDSTLRYQSTDRRGSFDAWGVGLFYHYSAPVNTLEVYSSPDDQAALLLQATLSKNSQCHVQDFVSYFDKVSQIKALMLSNQTSVNIADTMESERLRGVLINTCSLAKSVCALTNDKLRSFVSSSKEMYELKHFSIKHLCCQASGEKYYRARLKTYNSNEIVARSITMHGVLMTLSEKIIRDLIALEFSTRHNTADNLLIFSSQLTTISRVMNQNFYPLSKIRPVKKRQSFENTTF